MRNFVMEAADAYYRRDGKTKEVKQMYEEAIVRFPMIHILIGMAHLETVKAIDMIEEDGLRQHRVKQHLKEYEKRYTTYDTFIYKHMKGDARALMQDYVLTASKKAEYRCVMLRQACYNYLKKRDIEKSKLLAQCEVAFLLWTVATDTFTTYFDTYKEACGVDFRNNFSYADMTKCRVEFEKTVNELIRGIGGIDFNDDRRCRDSWEALKAEIDNSDFFNDAAGKALELNKGIAERYGVYKGEG